jgi:hypothetical protein
MPSCWGIKLKGTPVGGDYDVMSAAGDLLIYTEVKSAPPKHIDNRKVTAFLKRVRALRPSIAFFLVDTQLRMRDKIVPLFQEALEKQRPGGAGSGNAAASKGGSGETRQGGANSSGEGMSRGSSGRGDLRRGVQRLQREIFHVGRNLFLVNSDPDIAVNLTVCLKHFHDQSDGRFASYHLS